MGKKWIRSLRRYIASNDIRISSRCGWGVRLHPGDDGDDNDADRPLPAQVQADTESGAVVVINHLLQMVMEELRRHFALAGANSQTGRTLLDGLISGLKLLLCDWQFVILCDSPF